MRRNSARGSSSRQKRRIEERLRVLNADPQNRRCVDCHALSPHFVVCGFGVLVCTRCSGVHTSFGHRIKGITVAEFSEAEVDSLGGNAAFLRLYLGKLPKDYVKPYEMGQEEVRRWIDDVYVKKMYYNEPTVDRAREAVGVVGTVVTVDAVDAGPADKPAVRPAFLDISEKEIAVVPLSDILGANTPILRVESKGAAEARQVAEELARKQEQEAGKAAEAAVSVDLLDEWDPFGAEENITVAENSMTEEGVGPAQERSAPELSGPSFQDEWATFVEDVKVEKQNDQGLPSVNDRDDQFQAQEARGRRAVPLEAFLDPAEAQMKQLQSAAGSSQRSTIDFSVPARTIPPPVPLEAFFPEFEEIRRTGVLPTGAPDPIRPRMAPQTAALATHAPSPSPAASLYQPRGSPPRVESTPAAGVTSSSFATSAPRLAMPSAVDRASRTVGYGNTFDGGYDLRAAHAPKASESGNPFA